MKMLCDGVVGNKKRYGLIRNKKLYMLIWKCLDEWRLVVSSLLEKQIPPGRGLSTCRFPLSFSLLLSTFVVDASVTGLQSVT